MADANDGPCNECHPDFQAQRTRTLIRSNQFCWFRRYPEVEILNSILRLKKLSPSERLGANKEFKSISNFENFWSIEVKLFSKPNLYVWPYFSFDQTLLWPYFSFDQTFLLTIFSICQTCSTFWLQAHAIALSSEACGSVSKDEHSRSSRTDSKFVSDQAPLRMKVSSDEI